MSSCLSEQEALIINGQQSTKERARVLKIIDRNRQLPVGMDISRALLFTQSFRKTEGQKLSLRWAKALVHIAENMPLYIGEDDLIVGRPSGKPGRNGILYPEIDGVYLLDLEKAHERTISPFVVSLEDFQIIKEEIYPYWKDKTFVQAYAKALPEETRQLIFGDDRENFSK